MKTFKTLFAGALMMLSMSATAQNIDADIKNVLQAQGDEVAMKSALKGFDKLYKKDPKALAKLARAFYENEDTIRAITYAEKCNAIVAKAAGKIECGDGFILLGDIAYDKNNPGDAAGQYEQAKYFAPSDPVAYEKVAGVYRRVNPEAAVASLSELRQLDPNYPVDAVAAGFYYDAASAGKKEYWAKARISFKKADVSKYREEDFEKAAYIEYLYESYDAAIDLCNAALQKFPNNVNCNRYAFFCYNQKKEYEKAIAQADKLFACPKFKGIAIDYKNYGQALYALKNYDEAISALENSLSINAEQPDLKKLIAQIYLEKGETIKGAELYTAYINDTKNPTFDDLEGFANMYHSMAVAAKGAEQLNYIKKEDAVYAQIQEVYPTKNVKYVLYKRAELNSMLDPELTEGLAKPYFDKFIEVVEAEDPSNRMLLKAYSFNASYNYFTLKNKAVAKTYWNKMLKIDPTNEAAKTALKEYFKK